MRDEEVTSRISTCKMPGSDVDLKDGADLGRCDDKGAYARFGLPSGLP